MGVKSWPIIGAAIKKERAYGRKRILMGEEKSRRWILERFDGLSNAGGIPAPNPRGLRHFEKMCTVSTNRGEPDSSITRMNIVRRLGKKRIRYKTIDRHIGILSGPVR